MLQFNTIQIILHYLCFKCSFCLKKINDKCIWLRMSAELYFIFWKREKPNRLGLGPVVKHGKIVLGEHLHLFLDQPLNLSQAFSRANVLDQDNISITGSRNYFRREKVGHIGHLNVQEVKLKQQRNYKVTKNPIPSNNNSKRFHIAYYLPGSIPTALHILIHVILRTTL